MTAVLPIGTGLAPVAEAAAPNGPKVVIVSGPVGSHNRHYKADANALAKVARKYTKNVVLIKTPNATWPAVKKAAQGASIFVYLGHGNGWPSKYRDTLWPFSQNGLGLDPASGADGSAHVYYGEAQVAAEIRFAPNAVVLLFHLCYASGNTEPGSADRHAGRQEAPGRQLRRGLLRGRGADRDRRCLRLEHPYLSRLFTATASMSKLFHGVPTYHGNDIAWDSFRTTGAKIVMDPTNVATGPYYHSIVYDPGLTAKLVTRTAYKPTDGTAGCAGRPGAATARSADRPLRRSGADDPDRLARRRPPAASPGRDGRRWPTARGSSRSGRSMAVPTATSGPTASIRPTARPATLYNYDPPGTLVGPNGDFVFDTFRVIVRASEPLDGTVTVRNATGDTVKTLTAADAWSVFDWDLRDGGARSFPDGHYTWSYAGTEPWANNPTAFSRSVRSISTRPTRRRRRRRPERFDPSGWYTTAATVKLTGKDALQRDARDVVHGRRRQEDPLRRPVRDRHVRRPQGRLLVGRQGRQRGADRDRRRQGRPDRPADDGRS